MSKKSKCSIEKLKDLPNNITKKIYNQVITTIYISATESKIIALWGVNLIWNHDSLSEVFVSLEFDFLRKKLEIMRAKNIQNKITVMMKSSFW